MILNANAIVQERRLTAKTFERHRALVCLSRAPNARGLEPIDAATALALAEGQRAYAGLP